MSCGTKHKMGGRARLNRSSKSRRSLKSKSNSQSKQIKKRSYKRRSYRHRKQRKMSGGNSGLVDSVTSGLHESAVKLTSNPYTPSNANFQPEADAYKGSLNPYFV